MRGSVSLPREVLGEDIPWIADLTRAKKPKRLPVVLTRREVAAVLGGMTRTERLLAEFLYGTGMRLIEAVQVAEHSDVRPALGMNFIQDPG